MSTTRRLLYNGIVRPYMYAFLYMIFGVVLFSCLEELQEEVLDDDDDDDNAEDDSFWEKAEDQIKGFLRHALTAPNATAGRPTNDTTDEASLVELVRSIKQPWRSTHALSSKYKPLKFGVPRKWGWEKSFRFVEALLTSIGYGDVVPTSPASKLITIVYAACGLPIFLNAIASTQDTFNEITDRLLIVYAKVRDNRTYANAKFLAAATTWMLYLHFGSLLFSSIFEHWPYETAFYFCFISLTTIGFGDYVPSTLSGVHTVDVDAVIDAKSKNAAFETIKPTLLILLRHAYTFIGLSITALWFDVLKNYWKGQLTLPDAVEQHQLNGDVKSFDYVFGRNRHSKQLAPNNDHNQWSPSDAHGNNINNDSNAAAYSYFNQQLADNDAGAEDNYGGPPTSIAKHLMARYRNSEALRAAFGSPPLSPMPPGERDARSPSPFRASIIEKIVRL